MKNRPYATMNSPSIQNLHKNFTRRLIFVANPNLWLNDGNLGTAGHFTYFNAIREGIA
jgi:hypothetical protein